MTVILGVDPGKKGALALVGNTGIIDVLDMPTVGTKSDISPALILDWLEPATPDLAVIEFVRSRPGQSAPAVFNFGRGYGILECAVAALRVRAEYPTPAKWKRDMGLSSDKGESRAMAIRLWPDRSDLFKRVKDDGRAEACLIAEWGRRNLTP